MIVDIIAWIVLGAIAGYLAGFLVRGDESLGVIGHIVLGIVGALIGGFAANLIGFGSGREGGDVDQPPVDHRGPRGCRDRGRRRGPRPRRQPIGSRRDLAGSHSSLQVGQRPGRPWRGSPVASCGRAFAVSGGRPTRRPAPGPRPPRGRRRPRCPRTAAPASAAPPAPTPGRSRGSSPPAPRTATRRRPATRRA